MSAKAGADDNLTMSGQPGDSARAIGREVALSSDAAGAASLKTVSAGSPAWDTAAALERVEGDRELLEELAQLFAEECPKAMQEIRDALEAKDAALLERHAHTMKGSSSNIGANGAAAAALLLEQRARSRDLAKAPEDFRILQAEIGRLMPELEALSSKRIK
jgi:HPt (histidine-containing phosphotransfer) domain-containing protein